MYRPLTYQWNKNHILTDLRLYQFTESLCSLVLLYNDFLCNPCSALGSSIRLEPITVRELCKGASDTDDEGPVLIDIMYENWDCNLSQSIKRVDGEPPANKSSDIAPSDGNTILFTLTTRKGWEMIFYYKNNSTSHTLLQS